MRISAIAANMRFSYDYDTSSTRASSHLFPMLRRQLLTGSLAFGLLLSSTALHAQTAPPAAEVAQASFPAPSLQRDAAGLVTISGTAEDQVICYTLDGTEPHGKSAPYLASIDLSHGGKLKARILSKDRKIEGEVASAEYQPLPGHEPLSSSLVPVTQDRSWPGYDWTKRHAEVCAAVHRQNPQVIFIGDSITHFFGNGAVWKKNYEPLNTVDMGFGWDRTENVLWRLEHGELDGAAPKVAVVMIGTNNLATNKNEEIAAGIKAICEEVHQRTASTKILLLGIFPRGEKPSALRDRIAYINEAISKFNGTEGITYLDIGAKFINPDGTISKDIMADFLHPTQKGYQIWVDAMAPTLDSLLGVAAK